MSSVLTIKPTTRSQSRTRISGWAMIFWRWLWLITTGSTLALFLIALPSFYNELRMADTGGIVPFGSNRLYAEDIAILTGMGVSIDTYALYVIAFQLGLTTLNFAVGLLIFWRKSNDWMAVFTSLLLVLLASVGRQYPIQLSLVAFHPEWYLPVAWLAQGMMRVAFVMFILIFPSGRFAPYWTRWYLWGMLVIVHLPVLFPDTILNWYRWTSPASFLVDTVNAVIGIGVLVYRYRHVALPVERQQTKWVAFGVSASLLIIILLSALIVVFIPSVNQPGLGHLLLSVGYSLIIPVVSSLIAITIGFSVFRYRLWDVDFLINRGLIYGSITFVLALIFLASLFILQQVFQFMTGGMQSPVALAISALVIGTAFQPLQQRLRQLINHHFYHLIIDPDKLDNPTDTRMTYSGLSFDTLGQYRIIEAIGRGGMGEVYKAEQPALNRVVAIKILAHTLTNEAEYHIRFEREAHAIASLQHPNVVQIYDFGYDKDIAYMVMEYIEGCNLSQRIKETGRLPFESVAKIITDIAHALDYVHSKGLVHRDVKPSNVMLHGEDTPKERAILMDFGVARLQNSQTQVTGAGLVGTLDYTAPEQIMASHDVDHRADIYALGIMAYQLLTGELPFHTENPSQMVFAHLYKPAPDPRAVFDIPDAAADAILKALEKNPTNRFGSAGAFAEAFVADIISA